MEHGKLVFTGNNDEYFLFQAGESDLETLIRTMKPSLMPEVFVFLNLHDNDDLPSELFKKQVKSLHVAMLPMLPTSGLCLRSKKRKVTPLCYQGQLWKG